MTHRIQTLIQRSSALVIAATVTLAMLGGIDHLASTSHAPDALLAQQALVSQGA